MTQSPSNRSILSLLIRRPHFRIEKILASHFPRRVMHTVTCTLLHPPPRIHLDDPLLSFGSGSGYLLTTIVSHHPPNPGPGASGVPWYGERRTLSPRPALLSIRVQVPPINFVFGSLCACFRGSPPSRRGRGAPPRGLDLEAFPPGFRPHFFPFHPVRRTMFQDLARGSLVPRGCAAEGSEFPPPP